MNIVKNSREIFAHIQYKFYWCQIYRVCIPPPSLGLVVPDRSPSPPKVITDSSRIGAEEDVDEFEGKTEQEIQEIVGQRAAKANAQILEMVGDIPDADGRPPENVLFVCKLNPVTTGEDLEIIFSRFGPILSCEVIKDQKTADSLQYAFIEFENEEDCVSAYFKMDNVLIDDRRIHVDFSQSLAKVKGVRRRTTSEDQPSSPQKDDGLVSTRKDQGGDGYEMVFDDSQEKVKRTKRKKYRTSESGSDSERRHSAYSSEEKRERSDVQRRRDGGSKDEQRRERAPRERDDRRRGEGREREKDRYRQRDSDEKRHKYRKRSRSRERHQYRHSRGRSRSRSRERRHRH